MNLRQLEIFHAVMTSGTTVGAAEALGMSQPAVSNAIRHLELVVGFTLFERLSNRLVATEEAKLLYARAEPIFQLQQSVNQSALDIKAGHIGRIRVVATSEVTESLVPMAMREFLERFPDVFVVLDTKPLHNVLEAVEAGIADVGFAIDPGERHSLLLQPIDELRTVCICSADSPLSKLPFVTPQDLAQERLICPLSGTRIAMLLEEAFRKSAIPYEPKVEVRFLNAAARIVQEGWGVALLDEVTATSGHYSDLTVLPFEPRIPRPLTAILSRSHAVSRHSREFIRTFTLTTGTRIAEIRG
ncbi:LysR family transcriptional regulator [Martelella limonii]|uniref:LysR family transcriptional regulator n=1 Tax=Martelella limonii TaxID=1647649 RepID=UPI0015808CB2|nr:LysR family transcriptional regulator [Martelella limonii]